MTGFLTEREKKEFYDSLTEQEKQDIYDELSYRIMCGQLYQQNTIDRAKGIIAKPMPKEWYDRRASRILDTDDDETIKRKKINQLLAAERKPYFMVYRYPELKKKYNDWLKCKKDYAAMYYGCAYDALSGDQKEEVNEKFEDSCPVGTASCLVNRISWIFEKEFDGYLKSSKQEEEPFDYTIYKSEVEYDSTTFKAVKKLWVEAVKRLNEQKKKSVMLYENNDDRDLAFSMMISFYKSAFACICPNEKELCNILLDIGYQKENTMQYVWDICGEVIVDNLLEKNNHEISFPVLVDDNGEFEYMGQQFVMKTCVIPEDWDNEE